MSTKPPGIFHASTIQDVVIIFQVSRKSVEGSRSCEEENRSSSSTWPMAYTKACTGWPKNVYPVLFLG